MNFVQPATDGACSYMSRGRTRFGARASHGLIATVCATKVSLTQHCPYIPMSHEEGNTRTQLAPHTHIFTKHSYTLIRIAAQSARVRALGLKRESKGRGPHVAATQHTISIQALSLSGTCVITPEFDNPTEIFSRDHVIHPVLYVLS